MGLGACSAGFGAWFLDYRGRYVNEVGTLAESDRFRLLFQHGLEVGVRERSDCRR